LFDPTVRRTLQVNSDARRAQTEHTCSYAAQARAVGHLINACQVILSRTHIEKVSLNIKEGPKTNRRNKEKINATCQNTKFAL